MKRYLIAIVLLTATCANAQEFGASIDAGFVASQIDGDRFGGYNKFGFTAGGSVHRFFVKNTIGAKMGLRYVRKGSHSEETEHSQFYMTELHYAELPITAFYRWKDFEFEAGLSAGYLLKAKEDTDGYGLREPNYQYRKADICAIAGVRYNLFGDIWANAQFNYSAIAIRKYHSAQDTYMVSGQHNNLLLFGLSYQFNPRK